MITISPSELAIENVVDIMKRLRENDVLLLALQKRGPRRQDGKKQYNKPFAVLVQWPPSPASLKALIEMEMRLENAEPDGSLR